MACLLTGALIVRLVHALLAPPSPARRRVGMRRQRLGVAGEAGAGVSGDDG